MRSKSTGYIKNVISTLRQKKRKVISGLEEDIAEYVCAKYCLLVTFSMNKSNTHNALLQISWWFAVVYTIVYINNKRYTLWDTQRR